MKTTLRALLLAFLLVLLGGLAAGTAQATDPVPCSPDAIVFDDCVKVPGVEYPGENGGTVPTEPEDVIGKTLLCPDGSYGVVIDLDYNIDCSIGVEIVPPVVEEPVVEEPVVEEPVVEEPVVEEPVVEEPVVEEAVTPVDAPTAGPVAVEPAAAPAELAYTGVESGPLAALGVLVLVVGVMLLRLARRRS